MKPVTSKTLVESEDENISLDEAENPVPSTSNKRTSSAQLGTIPSPDPPTPTISLLGNLSDIPPRERNHNAFSKESDTDQMDLDKNENRELSVSRTSSPDKQPDLFLEDPASLGPNTFLDEISQRVLDNLKEPEDLSMSAMDIDKENTPEQLENMNDHQEPQVSSLISNGTTSDRYLGLSRKPISMGRISSDTSFRPYPF